LHVTKFYFTASDFISDKCQQVKCEHNCIVNTGTELAECQCFDGYELASDKLQCTGITVIVY